MPKTLRLKRPVIAITGSAGKSTTKEMLASILSTRWQVFKSVDNLNFFTHTRRYATQILPRHRAVVLEYGMSGPGHIKKHCQAIEPNYAVITNIGSAHIGAFGGDVTRLARAKSELIRYMNRNGTAVVNADDANTRLIVRGNFHGRTLKVGIDNPANYRARHVRYVGAGMAFEVDLDGKTERLAIPIVGRHHVYNALCAVAIADSLGFTGPEIRRGLRRYRRMPRRTTVYRFKRNITLIDDSYSSNPEAAKAAIDTLLQVGGRRKIAVLGSMAALGKHSYAGHTKVGKHLAKKELARLYTFGLNAKRIGTAAVSNGFPSERVCYFTDKRALHRRLLKDLKPNTTVLVKGSHGVRMMDTADWLRRQLTARKAKG